MKSIAEAIREASEDWISSGNSSSFGKPHGSLWPFPNIFSRKDQHQEPCFQAHQSKGSSVTEVGDHKIGKMFFVFDVDKAIHHSLSIDLHAGNVADLQRSIAEKCHIGPSNQLIMVSGGKKLSDPAAQLLHYGTGTESNPVFMFRLHKEAECAGAIGNWYNPYQKDFIEFNSRVEEFHKRPVHSLLPLHSISHDISSKANKLLKDLNSVVRDQEFMQQGWFALLAHLDDSLVSFKKYMESYKTDFQGYVTLQPMRSELLDKFAASCALLAKIPLSYRILECAAKIDTTASRTTVARGSGRRSRNTSESSIHSFGMPMWPTPDKKTTAAKDGGAAVAKDSSSSSSAAAREASGQQHQSAGAAAVGLEGGGGIMGGRKKRESDSEMSVMFEFEEDEDADTEKTLFQWMNERSEQDIMFYAETCRHSLETMSESVFHQSMDEHSGLVALCQDPTNRVVTGLAHRMSGLHDLHEEVKQRVELLKKNCDKLYMAKVDINRREVYTDFLSRLVQCVGLFKKIIEEYGRIFRSRLEIVDYMFGLTSNIIDLLEKMHAAHSRMVLMRGNISSSIGLWNVVRNVVDAPRLFFLSIAEIRRRTAYSRAFKKWSEPLVQQVVAIHAAEVERRSSYRAQVDKHFFNTLFKGLVENPPSHWSKSPRDFDTDIPHLSHDYLSRLATIAPEYAELVLREPHPEAVPSLLMLHATAGGGALVTVTSGSITTTTAAAAAYAAAQHASSRCFTSLSGSSLALEDNTLSSSSASVEVFASAVNTPPTPTTTPAAACGGGGDSPTTSPDTVVTAHTAAASVVTSSLPAVVATSSGASAREHHESETDTEEFEQVPDADGVHQQTASSPDSLTNQEYLTAEFDLPDTSELATQHHHHTVTTASLLLAAVATVTTTVTSSFDSSGSKSREDLTRTLQIESASQRLLPQLQKQLADIKADLTALKGQVTGDAASHVASVASVTSDITAAVAKLVLQSELSAAADRCHSDEVTQHKLSDLENEVELYHKQILDLREHLENVEAEQTDAIASVRAQYENRIESQTMKSQSLLNQASSKLQAELERLDSEHLGEVTRLRDAHEAELQRQQTDCGALLEELKSGHAGEVERLKEAHSREVAKMSLEHETEGLTWKEEWRQQYAGESERLAKELLACEESLKDRMAELQALQQEKRVRGEVLEEQYRVREQNALQELAKSLEESFNAKLSSVKADHEAETAKLSNQLVALKDAHDQLLNESHSTKEKLEAEQASLVKQHQVLVKRIEGDMAALKKQAEDDLLGEKTRSEGALSVLVKERDTQLENALSVARAATEDELKEAREAWRQEKGNMEATGEKRLEELRKSLLEEKRCAVEALKSRFRRITSATEKTERVSSPDDEMSRLRDELDARQRAAVEGAVVAERARQQEALETAVEAEREQGQAAVIEAVREALESNMMAQAATIETAVTAERCKLEQRFAEEKQNVEFEVSNRVTEECKAKMTEELESLRTTIQQASDTQLDERLQREREEYAQKIRDDAEHKWQEELGRQLLQTKEKYEQEIDKMKHLQDVLLATKLTEQKKKHDSDLSQRIELNRINNERQTMELINRYKSLLDEKDSQFRETLSTKEKKWTAEAEKLRNDVRKVESSSSTIRSDLEKEVADLKRRCEVAQQELSPQHRARLSHEAELTGLHVVDILQRRLELSLSAAPSTISPEMPLSEAVSSAVDALLEACVQWRQMLMKTKAEEVEEVRRRALEEKREDIKGLHLKLEEEKKMAIAEKQAEVSRLSRQLALDKERVLEERDLKIILVEDENARLKGIVTELESCRSESSQLRRALEDLQQQKREDTLATSSSPVNPLQQSPPVPPQQKQASAASSQQPRSLPGSGSAPEAAVDMTASFMTLPGPSVTGVQGTPRPVTTASGASATTVTGSPIKRGYSLMVQVGSCHPGDHCLVVWDPHHRHYRLLLQHNILHFLHTDCFRELGLEELDACVTPVVAQVLQKEFCVAKKDGNRFRVPTDTKFYRVHVRLPEHVKKLSPVPEDHPSFNPAACVLRCLKTMQPSPLVLADVDLKELLSKQRLQLECLRQSVEKAESGGTGPAPPICCVRIGEAASSASKQLRKRSRKRKDSHKDGDGGGSTQAEESGLGSFSSNRQEGDDSRVGGLSDSRRQKADGSLVTRVLRFSDVVKESSSADGSGHYLDTQGYEPKSTSAKKSLASEFDDSAALASLQSEESCLVREEVEEQIQEDISLENEHFEDTRQEFETDRKIVIESDNAPTSEQKTPELDNTQLESTIVSPSEEEHPIEGSSKPATSDPLNSHAGETSTLAKVEGTSISDVLKSAVDSPGDTSSAEEADECSGLNLETPAEDCTNEEAQTDSTGKDPNVPESQSS